MNRCQIGNTTVQQASIRFNEVLLCICWAETFLLVLHSALEPILSFNIRSDAHSILLFIESHIADNASSRFTAPIAANCGSHKCGREKGLCCIKLSSWIGPLVTYCTPDFTRCHGSGEISKIYIKLLVVPDTSWFGLWKMKTNRFVIHRSFLPSLLSVTKTDNNWKKVKESPHYLRGNRGYLPVK